MLQLIKINASYYPQLADMLEEWNTGKTKDDPDLTPWSIFKNDYHDMNYYLEHLEITEETSEVVPDSTFFLYDSEQDMLLGAVNIRHKLNDDLFREGGHIGDGVRPSHRQKGYATKMIHLALEECRKLGMDKVLMICEKDNIGSAKSIMNNGGILEKEFIASDGCLCQRYWIAL